MSEEGTFLIEKAYLYKSQTVLKTVNVPLKNCLVHSPNVLQYKLYKQRLLSLGLGTFENPFWFGMKVEVSPQSLGEDVFIYSKFTSVHFSKVIDAGEIR